MNMATWMSRFGSLKQRAFGFVFIGLVVSLGIGAYLYLDIRSNMDDVRQKFLELIEEKLVSSAENSSTYMVSVIEFGSGAEELIRRLKADSKGAADFVLLLRPPAGGGKISEVIAAEGVEPSPELTTIREEWTRTGGSRAITFNHEAASGEHYRVVVVPYRPGADLMGFDSHRAGPSEPQGYLLLGIRESYIQNRLQGIVRTEESLLTGISLGGLSVLTLLLMSAFGLMVLILTPLEEMREFSAAIAQGDLTQALDPDLTDRQDEIGDLGRTFTEMTGSLATMVRHIQESSESLRQSAHKVSESSLAVTTSSHRQETQVDSTITTITEITQAVGGISENVSELAGASEEAATSAQELGHARAEIARNVTVLAESGDETTSSIQQMATSIQQVKTSIERLSAAADETATSVVEMDQSIKQVEQNARATEALTDESARTAATGMEVVHKSIEGITHIRESSVRAETLMTALSRRVEEIGKIITVIEEIAEQTNLLALNATIIAAQAGEHGKSFAVVADEIKDLAERTTESTKGITQLITTIQKEVKQAVSAVGQAGRLVEEGVKLSRDSGEVLEKINQRATDSMNQVREIARATVEQARGSAQINQAIEQITYMLEGILNATREQAAGSQNIIQAAIRVRDTTAQVRDATAEQERGAREIGNAIERINQMANHIRRSVEEHRLATDKVREAIGSIRESTVLNIDESTRLEGVVASLNEQSQSLQEAVGRFRVQGK
ncbi:MAG: HAMP domain-containing protein [Deltaproteobacteria bacterium]|nr:HAMP domain-containing protein [Deltaproteobacteria bacterium]